MSETLLFVFSFRTALDSLYHESMDTSEIDYWTAQGHDKENEEPRGGVMSGTASLLRGHALRASQTQAWLARRGIAGLLSLAASLRSAQVRAHNDRA